MNEIEQSEPARFFAARAKMNGKPVFTVPSRTVINFDSGFKKKLLCDIGTFTAGTACAYSCTYCYVTDAMRKQAEFLKKHGVTGKHQEIVVRRKDALKTAQQQIARANNLGVPGVIYASPLVDVAANMELVRETVEIVALILEETAWTIRLLSKSNLLPEIAKWLLLRSSVKSKERVIYGISTGTLDDRLAATIEPGTPLVRKRIESLHWLQDNGFRTFGMICPSLPMYDQEYAGWAAEMARTIRSDKCEHVWAEVINVRGESMRDTTNALRSAGYEEKAKLLENAMLDKSEWERYARATFEAHVPHYRIGQLRFLQYVTKETQPWWKDLQTLGAVLL